MIKGLLAGDTVEYKTDSNHTRVLIDNVGGSKGANAAFDVGGFTLTSGSVQTAALGPLAFVDDAPSIAQAAPTDATALITHDALTIGSNTDSDTQNFATAFTLASSSYGADGPGTTTWNYALGVTLDGEDSGLTSEGNTINLYLVSGKVIGSTSGTSGGILASNTVFDVAVSASGSVTLTQYSEIDHAAPGVASSYSAQQAILANGKISLTGTVVITDGDGDTATDSKVVDLGGNIRFVDDGPTAAIVRTTANVTLDETVGTKAGDANAATDDITVANTDPFAGAYGTPIGALHGIDLVDTTVTTGADSFGATTVVSLAIVGGIGSNSGLMTTSGTEIDLWLEAGGTTVTGRTGGGAGAVVFAISIDASGNAAVAQYASLRHPDATNPDDAVSLSGKLNAVVAQTDGDTDFASASVGVGGAIVFQDDGPIAFAPASTTLSNTGTAADTEALNTAGTLGSDGLGSLKFVDDNANDNYLYGTDGTTFLTSGGHKIVLSGFGTGTLTATTEGSALTVFTATLNSGTDQYTITFSQAIDDGSVPTTLLGAAPVRSGNPTFNLINNVGGTDLDLLFSGTLNGNVSSVNVSTTGVGVANQTMNIGEMLRIDFANNASLAGSPSGSDFNMGTHETVNDFAFLLSQNTPSGTTGTVLVNAYNANNDKDFSNDGPLSVTLVKVNGTVVFGTGATSLSINGHAITAQASGQGVVISGLNEGATGDGTGGDDPQITVHTADGFNRITLTNTGTLGGTDFDIAPAGVFQGVAGSEVAFNLPVQTTDGDGDASPVELIGVTLEPVAV